MARSFSVAYDYRCPFARNAHEHVVAGLRAGADWDVSFVPFSLTGAKLPGAGDWDRETDTGLLALEVSVALRDTQPEAFPAAHVALFALRHDEGRALRSKASLADAITRAGADADAAFAEVATGVPAKAVREEHDRLVAEHDVWGVPAFVAGGEAAFVRLMDRPNDDDAARVAVERLVDTLADWPSLNEFKHYRLPR